MGARNRHPWGTHNHIVQLPGFFVELLTVAEPEKLGNDAGAALLARGGDEILDAVYGRGLAVPPQP